MLNRYARCLALVVMPALGSVPNAGASGQPQAAPQAVSIPETARDAREQTADTDETVDSRRTRSELERILERHPPSLGLVLKMDPSLLHNAAYLDAYPALASFLREHPEVRLNSAYYLDGIRTPGDDAPLDEQARAFRLWEQIFDGLSVLVVMLLFTLSFGWLVRTLLDYRRWNRLARVQTEVHGKLLDRFGSNADILAYMETTAGRRFLESAPITLDAGPRALGAPLARIFWSVQAGLVLTVGGLGLRVVAWGNPDAVAQPIRAIGGLAIAIGVGFVASAAVSIVLSRRLGLIDDIARAPESHDKATVSPS